MKIFGYSINLSKQKAVSASNAAGDKKRATGAIRKQAKREVSFQIADIKSALTQAQNADDPNRGKLLDIYRYIMRDLRLKSLIRDAKIEILSEPWMIYNGDTPDAAATEAITKRWMTHLIEYILETEFWGYSVCELTWSNNSPGGGGGEGAINAACTLIDREYISIERQWVLLEGTINGPYLPYADVAWQLDLLEFGKRYDYGTLLECAYNVIWKLYSRSDWSRASEKFGMPILSITAGTTNPTELDDLEARAANFGSDGYIIGQAGDEINIIERAGQRLHDIYLDNIKLCNEENTLGINGQTATTDQKAFVGSAEVQERKMDKITTARLQMVADEFNEKALPYLVAKGILKEGHRFDYPELIRQKQRRLTGEPLASDTPPSAKGGPEGEQEAGAAKEPDVKKEAKPTKPGKKGAAKGAK